MTLMSICVLFSSSFSSSFCSSTDEESGQVPEDVPLSRRYLKAFYWAITTLSTVGYGDFTEKKKKDRKNQEFCMKFDENLITFRTHNVIFQVILRLIQTRRQSMHAAPSYLDR